MLFLAIVEVIKLPFQSNPWKFFTRLFALWSLNPFMHLAAFKVERKIIMNEIILRTCFFSFYFTPFCFLRALSLGRSKPDIIQARPQPIYIWQPPCIHLYPAHFAVVDTQQSTLLVVKVQNSCHSNSWFVGSFVLHSSFYSIICRISNIYILAIYVCVWVRPTFCVI